MLAAAGFRVEVEAPGVDERAVTLEDPVELARALAERKALAVARRRPDAWIVGADQVLFDGATCRGKPADVDDHRTLLRALRGREHVLVTGFAVIGPRGERVVDHDVSRLLVRADLTDGELDAYVETGEGSGCAGGYAVEGRGVWLFERIEGCFFNVLGLPLPKLIGALRALGWRLDDRPAP
jgi:septum formation protein